MQSRHVAVVGVGMVGSQIAEALANCAVGHLTLIDHDPFEVENAFRHTLPVEYLGRNKATAMADYLSKQIEGGIRIEPIADKVAQAMPDELLERWLGSVDLIVAATDDREAQRRVGQQALELGIPAIFPALYLDDGGEIIVQIDTDVPCFGCWDYFRTNEEQLRGVTGLPIAGQPVIYNTVRLCLGFLNPASADRDLMRNGPNGPPLQFFTLDRSGTLDRGTLTWRDDCPACGGEPIPDPISIEPPLVAVPPDSAEQWWPDHSADIEEATRPASPPPNTQPAVQHLPFVGSPATPSRLAATRYVSASPTQRWREDGTLLTACAAVFAALFIVLVIVMVVTTGKGAPAEISRAYKIKVDYHQSLNTMVRATHLVLDEEDSHLMKESDPPVMSGPAEVEVRLVRLTGGLKVNPDVAAGISYDPEEYKQWFSSLSQLGYRPATLPELLAFSEQYPWILGNPEIVELGSSRWNELEYWGASSGKLAFHSGEEDGFDELGYKYRFLAVHK
jgi:hypothetical protein